MGIPNLGPSLTMELMAWRGQVEKDFKFKPEHGVSMEDARQAGESVAAIQDFQARKVLMGAKQLDAMAEVGLAETNRDLDKFSTVAESARQVANQLRDFQSDRRPLERFLNSNSYITGAVAIMIPLVAALLWLIFG